MPCFYVPFDGSVEPAMTAGSRVMPEKADWKFAPGKVGQGLRVTEDGTAPSMLYRAEWQRAEKDSRFVSFDWRTSKVGEAQPASGKACQRITCTRLTYGAVQMIPVKNPGGILHSGSKWQGRCRRDFIADTFLSPPGP
jgi:hypothetical protein